jgi:hypothetical protein
MLNFKNKNIYRIGTIFLGISLAAVAKLLMGPEQYVGSVILMTGYSIILIAMRK